jgi:flagellar biosynthesis protein FlhF
MSAILETEPATGAQYRFVVRSADEAVRLLRERLGENARVVSVRQVEGAGLARFLRAPKLEVIAEVIEEKEPADPPDGEESPASTAADLPESVEPEPIVPEEKEANEADLETAPYEELARLLARGGIPPVTLAKIRSASTWPRIAELPLSMALNEITLLLRDEYQAQTPLPLDQRVAFIGGAGAGKTTALCKRLASDVFVRRRRAAVLKVDLDKANPSDGLAVFCEALGVPLSRAVEDLPTLLPNEKIYLDFPGIGFDDADEIEDYSAALDSLAVTSRILVINAAYEASVIKQIYSAGERLGATHVVFTHLDELTYWGKLWEFLLNYGLTALFLSSGQNIAGDFVEQVFPSVLARTFGNAGPDIAKSNYRL